MYDRTPRWLVIGLLAVSPCALAQQPPPAPAPAAPTRNVPRPDDLEPGVNTSATPPSATSPGASTSGAGAASGGASASGPTDTSSSTAPKVGKSSTSAKASAAGKPAANASAPAGATAAGTPGVTTNSGTRGGKAEDRLQLDTTQITGNQELPKVLYIVPWKRSDLGDLLGKPANSLLDEVLEPVDRDVFKRENRYYDALKPDATGGADKGAGAAGQGSGDKH
jgi:hypothetical protein